MKLSFKRKWAEYGMLLVVIGVLLWIGPGRIWNHKIDHGFPYAHSAQDAFWHQFRTQGIMEIGHYKYEPMVYFTGEYPDFPGYYPPILSQLGAVWATFSGLQSYHTTQGLVFFATLISAALMFFFIRKFNPTVALLSLPLYPFVFLMQATVNGFTWGHWPQITGLVFLVFIGWVMSQLSTKGWEVLLLWGIVGTVMTYTGHTIMVGFFLLIFLAFYTLKLGLQKDILIRFGLVGCGVVLLTSRYLIFFKNIWISYSPYKFHIITDWPGGGGVVTLGDFGLWWLIMPIGVVLATISLFQMIKEKKEMSLAVPLLFSLCMLILGYTNYIGFGKRAFFIRLFWPFFLSVFLGLGMYSIGRFLLQQLELKWNAVLASVVALILLSGILLWARPPETGQGIMSPGQWESLTWLRDSTPTDARVIFIYGDEFLGENLWTAQRYQVHIRPKDYVSALHAALQNASVRRYYLTNINTDTFPYMILPIDLHKEGPLNWGWSWNITYDFRLIKSRDICAYDYLFFSRNSSQPLLARYGLDIASKLLERPWITEVFKNDYALILRNERIGEACIENHQIE